MLAKTDGTTLKEHTNDLLEVLTELKEALPILTNLTKILNFWDLLKIAIIFHDIGKSTDGFQKLMKRELKSYRFRHEWLSAVVLNNIEVDKKDLLISAILSHHKDFEKINEEFEQSKINKKYSSEVENRYLEREFKTLDIKWIKEFLLNYQIELKDIKISNLENIVIKWISRRKRKKISELEKFQNIFFSATLSICDHNASGGIREIPLLKENNFNFLNNLKKPYFHQLESWKSKDNVLLIAPTGRGKTESAIGWLKNQISNRQGRIFYTLPFTASINAMTKRMTSEKDGFGDEKLVGLLHAKAKFFIDELYEQRDGESLKDLIDIHKKIVKPFKIVTPFQILKWAFGVKGFEKGLTELAGSYLIFDEIHIYNKEIFFRILFFIEWLIEKLQVKVFMMSATIPTFMQKMILDTLKIKEPIKAEEKLLKKTIRHRVNLLNGVIEDYIEDIEENLNNNKSVIVLCNSVKKAQFMYENINFNDKVLLHSNFNVRDRIEIEKRIEAKNKPKFLIGTQAIEVSLNIDYDLIFSEPAPLDSLLQRFGRVYRRRNFKSDNPNCYITKEIEETHTHIYKKDLIEKTLKELKKINNKILLETDIQKMLDNIYEPFELDIELRENLRNLIDNLYPYNRYEDSEEEYFKQFDGIEVLPKPFEDEWIEYIKNKNFLEAEKLLVSISKAKFSKYHESGHIEPFSRDEYKKIVPIIYLKYSNELGLLDEKINNLF